MYPLWKLETPLNKESIDKIGKPISKSWSMYPLMNLETPYHKETIDKIDNTFY